MPNRIAPLVGFLFIISFSSCKKSSSNSEREDASPKNSYKIEVLDGQNQTDTVGHQLKKRIKVKVYKNGELLENCILKFIGTGCTCDLATDFHIPKGAASIGESDYAWHLNEKAGLQTLRIILCDQGGKPLDSTRITATAIEASGKGFHLSACSGGYSLRNDVNLFWKLKSGRIITLYVNNGNYAYSDNNGLSWNSKTLNENYHVKGFATAPNGNLYMLAQVFYPNNNLIFKSIDEGNTWQQIYKDAITWDNDLNNIFYLPSGKLVCWEYYDVCKISEDEGKTWIEIFPPGPSQSPSSIYDIAENREGDLYVLYGKLNRTSATEFKRYQAGEGGTDWRILPGHYNSMLTDNKNDIYLAQAGDNPGIYKLNEKNYTVQRIDLIDNSFPSLGGTKIIKMKQGKDGYYYLYNTTKGLYRTKDFLSYEPIGKNYGISDIIDHIVADNNTLIVANGRSGYIHYMKQ